MASDELCPRCGCELCMMSGDEFCMYCNAKVDHRDKLIASLRSQLAAAEKDLVSVKAFLRALTVTVPDRGNGGLGATIVNFLNAIEQPKPEGGSDE